MSDDRHLGFVDIVGKAGHWRRDCAERIQNEAKQAVAPKKYLRNMEDNQDNVEFHMGKEQT